MSTIASTDRWLAQAFCPISLAALNAKAAMLERLDNKYVVDAAVLRRAADDLAGHFDILEIDALRSFTYETCYFDDAGWRSYFDHHQGKRRRAKVRIRRYVEAGLCFLEIKLKDKRGITVKTSAKVTSAAVVAEGVRLEFVAANKTESLTVEKLLVATGRGPLTDGLGARAREYLLGRGIKDPDVLRLIDGDDGIHGRVDDFGQCTFTAQRRFGGIVCRDVSIHSPTSPLQTVKSCSVQKSTGHKRQRDCPRPAPTFVARAFWSRFAPLDRPQRQTNAGVRRL